MYHIAQSLDLIQDFAPQQYNRKEENKKAAESFSSWKSRQLIFRAKMEALFIDPIEADILFLPY